MNHIPDTKYLEALDNVECGETTIADAATIRSYVAKLRSAITALEAAARAPRMACQKCGNSVSHLMLCGNDWLCNTCYNNSGKCDLCHGTQIISAPAAPGADTTNAVCPKCRGCGVCGNCGMPVKAAGEKCAK
jgi:hypothetical protein